METTRKYHDEKGIEIVFIDCLQMIDLAKGEVAAPERTARVMNGRRCIKVLNGYF